MEKRLLTKKHPYRVRGLEGWWSVVDRDDENCVLVSTEYDFYIILPSRCMIAKDTEGRPTILNRAEESYGF